MGDAASRPRLLHVAFDASARGTLREIILQDSRYFVEAPPGGADLILFGTDEIAYLSRNPLFKAFRPICLCVTETDIPTFFMPGLYAANRRMTLTCSRTKTMHYVISAKSSFNEEVRRLMGEDRSRRYLYTFMGGTNSWARRRLLKHVPQRGDTLLRATDSYNHWDKQAAPDRSRAAKRDYAETLASSKFALCPRGCGLSSYRLFEAMSLGVAPVIIADGWQPIETIDWSFALFVPERRIRDLDSIVRAHEDEWQARGAAALAAHRAALHGDVLAPILHQQLLDLLGSYRRDREAVMALLARARFAALQTYWAAYRLVKNVVLGACRLGRFEFPYALHNPTRK